MRKLNKRALQAQETKKMIYDHATRLIREKGFYNISIEDITSAAGVSIGTFYYYFQNKNDLLLLLADNLDNRYVEYYETEIKKTNRKNALEILTGIIHLSLEICSSLGAEFTAVIYSHFMRDPKANEHHNAEFRAYRRILQSLVREGQEEGIIRNDMSLESLVQSVYKAIRGGIIDWCINCGSSDIKEFTGDFVICFIDGIKPQAKAQI